jgi:transposase InsO family protein
MGSISESVPFHLFAKREEDRRVLLNAIGPVWDGNEVWLVTGGGALFAGFPDAYATVFSGFYIPFMLLLVSLIFRAVAIEFRGKVSSPMWRRMWDIAFAKRGYPESITVDNGSESCSRMMDAWAYRHGVKLDFIRPGKPVENGYISRASTADCGTNA